MIGPGPAAPRTSVITIVHGRHRHLQRQLHSMDAMTSDAPLQHVVVAMGDSAVAALVQQHEPVGRGVSDRLLADIAVGADGELPLAAARNLGADIALAGGAALLVFLDVDCLAHRDLVTDYCAALAGGRAELAGPVLWCGQVSYLPPLPPGIPDYPLTGLDTWAAPHPARPVPPAGATELSRDVRLFWSLNFAITAADWRAVDGFHSGYRGYGGEDTDFARTVGAQGGGLGWIGGAGAFHQHHPTSSPPWQHLSAIVRNAHVFRERWGRFPMEGWLEAFADAGAIDYRPDHGVLELTDAAVREDSLPPGQTSSRTQGGVAQSDRSL